MLIKTLPEGVFICALCYKNETITKYCPWCRAKSSPEIIRKLNEEKQKYNNGFWDNWKLEKYKQSNLDYIKFLREQTKQVLSPVYLTNSAN